LCYADKSELLSTKEAQVAYTKLRSIRYERGETQRALADVLEVTQATIHLWENGITRPRPAAARRLSDHFARPVSELLEIETTDPKARRGTRPAVNEGA
jgi:transcriptional regulator with XRE-family HTH domain